MNSNDLYKFLSDYAVNTIGKCDECKLSPFTIFRTEVSNTYARKFYCFECLGKLGDNLFICSHCNTVTHHPAHRPFDTAASNQSALCQLCASKFDSKEFAKSLRQQHKKSQKKLNESCDAALEELINIFNNEGGAGNRVASLPTKKKGGDKNAKNKI